MSTDTFRSVSTAAAMLLMCGELQAQPNLELWAVDPLVKVFPDASPQTGEATADVARGEHASLQVVVRSPVFAKNLKVDVPPLTREGAADSTLKPRAPRFVGYVPIDAGIPRPPADRLRVPPAFFPDPLLESFDASLTAGSAQPIWLTVPIPVDAPPAIYRGRIAVSVTAADGKTLTASLPLAVRVWPVTVKKTRLWVTNWFQVGGAPGWSQDGRSTGGSEIKQDSDLYWETLRRYARNMAEHRQNVVLISPLALAEFRAGADGLDIDFSRFDRWVEIFTQEGVIGRIEGGHIGGRAGGWESQFTVGIRRLKDGKVESVSVDPAGPEAEAFYARFFPALVKHLKAKGWLDKYLQHLADEPIDMNTGTYRALRALAAKHAPELRIVEACHSKDLTGAVQVWVPQLNFLHTDYAHYRERQAAGDEIWFYTCLGPQGEYANRFIEQPLIKTRLLHWINFRYGVTGYLHWGYNYWGQYDPYRRLAIPWDGGAQYLPAGDAWIVYPGKDGLVDSIRFEAMRDGIVDHELLSRLAERDAAAAKRLAETFVIDFDKYNTDVAAFRAARREILERLSQTEANDR